MSSSSPSQIALEKLAERVQSDQSLPNNLKDALLTDLKGEKPGALALFVESLASQGSKDAASQA